MASELEWTRRVLACLAAFVGLSAVAGGAAILAGWARFPSAWLAYTPFPDYTLPALVLGLGVGGCALGASGLLLESSRAGALAGMLAGAVLVAWVLAEVTLINAPKPSSVEVLYLVLGVVVLVMGFDLRKLDLGAGATPQLAVPR